MKRISLALLLASALALAHAAAAVEPLRLFEVFVTRVVEHEGAPAFQRGLLDALGNFEIFDPVPFPPPGPVPPGAMNKYLILTTVWFGYDVLGPQTLKNFDDNLVPVEIGEVTYFTIEPSNSPKVDIGALANLSARSVVTPGGEPLIGGLVIEDRSRRVMIRGIGPSLAQFGVTAPLEDPSIALYRADETAPFASNDDWSQSDNAEEIEAAADLVAAFPLDDASQDAAYLAELPQGTYTIHLTATGGTGGTALLEIYKLP